MIDTIQQMPLKDVPRGEFVRRKLDAKKTYTRGDYDRSAGRAPRTSAQNLRAVGGWPMAPAGGRYPRTVGRWPLAAQR
jgi:hypothetical protein